jgi:hypothetical protein
MAIFGELQFAVVNTAAAGNTTIVAAQGAGVKIRILAYLIVAAGAVVANLQSGAGGTSLTGPMTLATGTPNGARHPSGCFETAANALLNINLGAAVQVSGWIAWVPAT